MKWLKHLTPLELLVGFAIGLMIAVLVITTVDAITAKDVPAGTCKIVERIYQPATTSAGIGVSSGKGGGTVVTTNTSRETWLVVVDHDGEPTPVNVTSREWMRLAIGQHVELIERRGWFSRVGYRIGVME